MIDLHCHILPKVDDGAANTEEARLMAALAADGGITTIAATPHIVWSNGHIEERLQAIRSAADTFRKQLHEAKIPISLHLGAEVLCDGIIPNENELSHFPCFENTNLSLIEFDFDAKADYMHEWLSVLRKANIFPIVAHPERYTAVQANKDILNKWKEKHYPVQVNKGSFLGRYGKGAERVSHYMLKRNLIDFLASDAHNPYDYSLCTHQFMRHFNHQHEWIAIRQQMERDPFVIQDSCKTQ